MGVWECEGVRVWECYMRYSRVEGLVSVHGHTLQNKPGRERRGIT